MACAELARRRGWPGLSRPDRVDPVPDEVEPLKPIDDADGAGYRFDWESLYYGMAGPRHPIKVPAVVVSGDPNRWQRWPPSDEWWRPLTLADVDRIWQAKQREWASRMGAAHVIAHNADHLVHHDAPQLVIDVVAAVLAAVRRGDPTVQLDSVRSRRRAAK